MKTKDYLQLFTILFICSLIVAGTVIAATYKDTTPQKYEEKEVDGKMVEVATITPDIEKTIEKAWMEERTSSFTPQLRISELENMKAGIDVQIASYNKLQAELAEAVSTLNLTIDIPVKLIFK